MQEILTLNPTITITIVVITLITGVAKSNLRFFAQGLERLQPHEDGLNGLSPH